MSYALSMSIRPEVALPVKHPRLAWARANPLAIATLAVGALGLLVCIGHQLADGDLGAPPLWLSLPFASLAGAVAVAAVVARQRRWVWLGAGVGAGLASVFLGWFLLGLLVVSAIYLLLQLVG